MKKILVACFLASLSQLLYTQVIPLEHEQQLETSINQQKYCIVKAYLPNCKPCKDMANLFETFSEKHPEILCIEINCRLLIRLALSLGIRAVPTLLFYKDGKLVDRYIGPITQEDLLIKIPYIFA